MEKIRGMEYQQKTHWHTIGLTVMPKKLEVGVEVSVELS